MCFTKYFPWLSQSLPICPFLAPLPALGVTPATVAIAKSAPEPRMLVGCATAIIGTEAASARGQGARV